MKATETGNKPAQSILVAGTQTSYTQMGEREMVFTRVYDAPRDRVFRAFCDPKTIPDWWGPPGVTTKVETMDVRPGGAWRFVQADASGRANVFFGAYREVDPPRRIRSTLQYQGAPFVIEETYEFVDQGPTTLLRVTSAFPQVSALNGMLAVGMQSAGQWPEGSRHQWRLERLAAVVGG